MRSWNDVINETTNNSVSEVSKINLLGKKEIEVKIGEYQVTKVTGEDWKKLLDVAPLSVEVTNEGKQFLASVQSYDDKYIFVAKEHTLENIPYTAIHAGSSTGYTPEQLGDFYTIYDYTKDYDFIRLPKKFVNTYKTNLYVHVLETNEIYPVSNIDEYDIEYKLEGKYKRLSWNWGTDKFDLLVYVGLVKHRYELTGIEDIIGRFAYCNDTFSKNKYFKFIRYQSQGFRISAECEGYKFLDDDFKTGETITFRGIDHIVWLDKVDETLRNKGNQDENGLDIINPIKVDSDRHRIDIETNSVISSEEGVCITTLNCSELTIASSNNSTLVLKAGPQQPCIGLSTHTNMSYGRWSPSPTTCKLEKIILDGINLVLESKVENFSIGTYNYEEYPEIVLLNGATITGCPEVEGKRILAYKAKPPAGSTKISEMPKYIIMKEGQSEYDESLLPESLLEIKRELEKLNPEYAKLISIKTKTVLAHRAVELLELNPKLDVARLLKDPSRIKRDCVAIGSVVLDMSEENAYLEEFFYESSKIEYLLNKYAKWKNPNITDTVKQLAHIARKLYYDAEWDNLSEWGKAYIYEMIPSYLFDFTHNDEVDTRTFYEME